MVFNSSFDSINYAMQVSSEQDIKAYIICWFIVMGIIFFYLDRKKFVEDKRISITILKTFFKIFYFTVLIYSPYLVLSFYSYSVSLAELSYFLIGLYIAFMIGGILITAFYLVEKLFKDLGWEMSLDGLKIKVEKLEDKKK